MHSNAGYFTGPVKKSEEVSERGKKGRCFSADELLLKSTCAVSCTHCKPVSFGLVTEFLLRLTPAMAIVGDRHALLELLFADFVVKWQAAAAVKSKTEDVNKVVKCLEANGYKKASMVKSTDEADTNTC